MPDGFSLKIIGKEKVPEIVYSKTHKMHKHSWRHISEDVHVKMDKFMENK